MRVSQTKKSPSHIVACTRDVKFWRIGVVYVVYKRSLELNWRHFLRIFGMQVLLYLRSGVLIFFVRVLDKVKADHFLDLPRPIAISIISVWAVCNAMHFLPTHSPWGAEDGILLYEVKLRIIYFHYKGYVSAWKLDRKISYKNLIGRHARVTRVRMSIAIDRSWLPWSGTSHVMARWVEPSPWPTSRGDTRDN